MSCSLFFDRMNFKALILNDMPPYYGNVERLLRLHHNLWMNYHENIGKIMEYCTDDSLNTSFGMFEFVESARINVSDELQKFGLT